MQQNPFEPAISGPNDPLFVKMSVAVTAPPGLIVTEKGSEVARR